MAAGPIGELVHLLSRLPGVGERSATRLAFFILGLDASYAKSLAAALDTLHERVKRCTTCRRKIRKDGKTCTTCGNYGAREECDICLDPRRNAQLVCVVARVPDLLAIERGGASRPCSTW